MPPFYLVKFLLDAIYQCIAQNKKEIGVWIEKIPASFTPSMNEKYNATSSKFTI